MSSLLQFTQNTRFLPGSAKFIRSDVPTRLSEADLAFLADRGVTTVVDLRTAAEREKKPCPLAELPGFAYHCIPIHGGDTVPPTCDDVPRSYLAMLDGQMEQAISVLEHAPAAAIYFCNAGKDRTGVVSALLLRHLGADDETIVQDYVLTAENLRERIEIFIAAHPERDMTPVIPQARYMQEFLQALPAGWE